VGVVVVMVVIGVVVGGGGVVGMTEHMLFTRIVMIVSSWSKLATSK